MKENENRNKKRLVDEGQSSSGSGMVMDVVPGGTLQIPSGSNTYHIKGDASHWQDDPWSQSNERKKKRRIAGKQKSTLYPQPNVPVKRKAEKQGGSGIKRKSRSRSDSRGKDRNHDDRYVVAAAKSPVNLTGNTSLRLAGPELEVTESLVYLDSKTLLQRHEEQSWQAGASGAQSRDGVDLYATSQGPGVHKCGPSVVQMKQTGVSSTQSRDEADPFCNVPGSGGAKMWTHPSSDE